MSEADKTPGVCPVCGTGVPVPEFLAGTWSGCKKTGMLAGGGFFQTPCPQCGTPLIAYEDVYDESGNVPILSTPSPPALFWSVDEEAQSQ